MKDAVEDPGGDLRAVEGTKADVAITTDKPLASGVLMLDDGSKLTLKPGSDGLLMATVPIQKDGVYHIAALEGGEDVRLSEDYFIEAQRDKPPEIKMTRPGRDYKASPIEEVAVQVEAKDDFGLKTVELHYSVNGGRGEGRADAIRRRQDRDRHVHDRAGRLQDRARRRGQPVRGGQGRADHHQHRHLLHRSPALRAQLLAIAAGAVAMAAAADDDQDQNKISQRQKEIIAATWNQLKGMGAKGTDADNAAFLAGVQSKLRDQARSLGRAHEGAPVDRSRRCLQELREGYGDGRGGHGRRPPTSSRAAVGRTRSGRNRRRCST